MVWINGLKQLQEMINATGDRSEHVSTPNRYFVAVVVVVVVVDVDVDVDEVNSLVSCGQAGWAMTKDHIPL